MLALTMSRAEARPKNTRSDRCAGRASGRTVTLSALREGASPQGGRNDYVALAVGVGRSYAATAALYPQHQLAPEAQLRRAVLTAP